jgi:protein involved in polysaccharide export with SLBB domain
VTEPVAFVAPEPMKLLEVIAQAKGLTPMADLKKATVVRAEGAVTVDLEKLWGQGDLSQNILVRPGETVIVPTRDPQEVMVVGAVTTPAATDTYRTHNRSILRLVQMAVPKPTADLRHVLVQRVGASAPIVVDLKAVADEGNLQADVQAEPGDLIFVPELKKVYAIGAFNAAGVYPLADNMTVMDLVALAGSFRPDGLPAKMRLIRPSEGSPQVTNVDFRRVERGLDTANTALMEGDILYVPAKGLGRGGWEWWRDVLWSGASLFSIFR